MSEPASYRPAPGEIPREPGVYRFSDSEGRVIYVGKAKSLRPRLTSYFQDVFALHPRTRNMVQTATAVQWTVVANEVEALQLEYSWIKEFDPRFNVKYRDDKSYPYLAVTMSDEFPRALVMRGAKRRGTRYFGPYTHVWAIRETLDLLLRIFPVRTCSAGVFRRAGLSGRPCLLGYIDKCSAPCVARIGAQEHRILAEELCAFLDGHSDRFVRRIERRMREASAGLEFELAARLRDQLTAARTALEKSTVVLPDGTDADVFGVTSDELETSVQVFHVRSGRIKGQRGWIAERQGEDDSRLIERLLTDLYAAESADRVPREILLPTLPPDADTLISWLIERRGGPVDVRVPQRGDKKALAQTAAKNAEQALARHKLRRSGDLTNRSLALSQLQEDLGLAQAPLRIECFDISHTQGTNVVGSMVVFEDGLARKSEYRRFIVRGASPAQSRQPDSNAGEADHSGSWADDVHAGNDDTAAMREVLTRRFARRAAAQSSADNVRDNAPQGAAEPQLQLNHATQAGADTPVTGEIPPDQESERPARFAYSPGLIVVDGGLPQVRAAQQVLTEVGASDVAVIGLAKRLEEVWLPDDEFPVILPRTSEALFLLQRLRDEAHRFAITFHRQRRSKAMTRSALDQVRGLGAAKSKLLLSRFGSVAAIRRATAQELTAVPGIGPALAANIIAALATSQPGPQVNTATGEVT